MTLIERLQNQAEEYGNQLDAVVARVAEMSREDASEEIGYIQNLDGRIVGIQESITAIQEAIGFRS